METLYFLLTVALYVSSIGLACSLACLAFSWRRERPRTEFTVVAMRVEHREEHAFGDSVPYVVTEFEMDDGRLIRSDGDLSREIREGDRVTVKRHLFGLPTVTKG